eukprot:gene11046-7679_t
MSLCVSKLAPNSYSSPFSSLSCLRCFSLPLAKEQQQQKINMKRCAGPQKTTCRPRR